MYFSSSDIKPSQKGRDPEAVPVKVIYTAGKVNAWVTPIRSNELFDVCGRVWNQHEGFDHIPLNSGAVLRVHFCCKVPYSLSRRSFYIFCCYGKDGLWWWWWCVYEYVKGVTTGMVPRDCRIQAGLCYVPIVCMFSPWAFTRHSHYIFFHGLKRCGLGDLTRGPLCCELSVCVCPEMAE